MNVSILASDLSSNSLGRAFVLAQLAERNHNVEIIGPELGDGIWEPIKSEYDYKGFATGRFVHQFAPDVPKLTKLITGDVIYASKPRTSSYGIGLLKSLRTDHNVILDIDDWESGFVYNNHNTTISMLTSIPKLVSVNSFYYKRFLEYCSKYADEITVSNSFLQNKFGGTIVPHARDTDYFNPYDFNKVESRENLDLPMDEFIVIFSGTPKPYKGIHHLVDVLSDIKKESVLGVIVGCDDSDYVKSLKAKNENSVLFFGKQPFDDLPEWIAASDAVVIPQQRSSATHGQLPAKVFDAMAMAKPIIASRVSDLPQILEDCGLIVEPGNKTSLKKAILRLYENPNLCQELGENARRKCITKYSYNALEPVVDNIIESASYK